MNIHEPVGLPIHDSVVADRARVVAENVAYRDKLDAQTAPVQILLGSTSLANELHAPSTPQLVETRQDEVPQLPTKGYSMSAQGLISRMNEAYEKGEKTFEGKSYHATVEINVPYITISDKFQLLRDIDRLWGVDA